MLSLFSDLIGCKIMEGKGTFIDLSSFEKGIYILSLRSQNTILKQQKILNY
tara:strand:+ start:1694 stop:1846 length:153 start_codon:yes stop_codon:yes gene_type:complete